ncbi:endonuclease I family protein [Bacillus sp. B-jedd]|uniref:endonuclease I family protein n=1 Tax=Bacillus sp. B-jedd TaxID=1476857 RepID=UPI000515543B|nr:endonuclease [Bacillus sp. B-jedd]CEG28632.1 extracellular ribonuclease precursor [Bacillus sp. B-jedd]
MSQLNLSSEIRSLLKNNADKPYYNEYTGQQDKFKYYKDIDLSDLKNNTQRIIESTHKNRPSYAPHRYVYPWVDLQENGELKSLYSGRRMDVSETILHDMMLLKRLEKNELGALSGNQLFNCEHVVPQSWFDGQEPMRGDLHHLFACEPSCNLMRSNFPYHDFASYEPEVSINRIREGCGMAEEKKFEPEYGKGIVSRATMYFMLRYKTVDIRDKVNLALLLAWHNQYPVTKYEKHRNAAIFEIQGNRNPFIDYPEWAETLI